MNPEVKTRPAVAADHPFIYSTYLKNRWFHPSNETTLRKDTWHKLQHKRLEGILESQPVTIVCLAEDDDVILGYGFQDGSMPFRYVKKAFRDPKLGIVKMLEEVKS